MMNDSVFLQQFYGPTLLWFGPIFGLVGLLIVFGNGLLLWIALTTHSIRSVDSHWFVISIAVSDLLFGLNSFGVFWIAHLCAWNGSCSALVKFSGALCVISVESAFVFPTFIVASRYLKVTKLPNDSSRLRRFFSSSKAVPVLCSCAWTYVFVLAITLAAFDYLGEDALGLYCAKRFKSFWIYLIYLTGAFYAMTAYTATFYFYGRLQKFVMVNVNRTNGIHRSVRLQHRQRQENNDSREVMRMVKLATLMPLITQGGVFILNGGQWFIPDDLVPMWIRRIITISFAITPMCGPWLSMLILGPFKRELKRRFALFFPRILSEGTVTNVNIVGPAT